MTPTNRTDEARRLAKTYCFREADVLALTDDFISFAASAITSAVEAERERCAKVAEHQATICGSSMSRQTTAHDIAFNIRQTPTKEWV